MSFKIEITQSLQWNCGNVLASRKLLLINKSSMKVTEMKHNEEDELLNDPCNSITHKLRRLECLKSCITKLVSRDLLENHGRTGWIEWEGHKGIIDTKESGENCFELEKKREEREKRERGRDLSIIYYSRNQYSKVFESNFQLFGHVNNKNEILMLI